MPITKTLGSRLRLNASTLSSVAALFGKVRQDGMIEKRPLLTFFSHLVLAIGVVIVAFPVYVTFVASSQTAEAVLQEDVAVAIAVLERFLTHFL